MNPIGIDLPIVLGKTGYFKQTYSTLEEAKVNLINLLFTRYGERLMQPTFGTKIYELLFENITLDIPEIIESEIREQTKKWIPYIFISTIDVNVSKKYIDNNKIKITIVFSVNNVTELETLNLEFNF